MNQSIIISNSALSKAYHYFQNGELKQSLSLYQQSLKSTFPEDLKLNIKCTMAIIEHSFGNYDRINQLLGNLSKVKKESSNILLLMRVYANLTMFSILQGHYTIALEHFGFIMEIIQSEKDLENKNNLLKFATYLFFRVNDFAQISEEIENIDLNGSTIEQLYCLSLMAFSSQICKLECQQKIQKRCFQEFKKQNRFDLAIFSLRSLLFFTKSQINRQKYEKQLAKLVMMGHLGEQIDFQNFQPYEVIQAIMEQFGVFKVQIAEEIVKIERKVCQMKQSSTLGISTDSQIIIEWKFAISLVQKQIQKTREKQQTKQEVLMMLSEMKREQNPLIIRNLSRNNYFHKYFERSKKTLGEIPNLLIQKVRGLKKYCFQRMIKFDVVPSSMEQSLGQKNKVNLKIDKKHDRSKSYSKMKEDKENNPPSLGISVVTIGASKVSQVRKKIFQQHSIQSMHKKTLRMVRVCEYGSFLNKRNFNSEGGEFKFVKINNSFIKWGKDPQKIETNCQIYPLKDIKSIIYGRVSPNLNESWNKMLNYQNCFSLLLQKRTLDFYCKNYEELQSWVCGMSHVLKKDGSRVVGYSPGKLRWKKMFSILRQHFIEPLKVTERHKYYYENAYAVKLFGQNGYKLPSKSTVKR